MITYKLIKECRELVLQGASIRDIANLLSVPESTVRLYTKREMKLRREKK